ncbi:hypothetical protein SESBI_39707 [Sesbania bispinosa]|nr:hypothetical protein SESBI_39707 [Sesbania bispinosa]
MSRGKWNAFASVSGKKRLRPEELRTCGERELEGSEEGKPEFFKDNSGNLKFPLCWSPCPVRILGVDSAALSVGEMVEVKFLKEIPPLKCMKLIRLGDDPVKLKNFMDQMAPKLDRKALSLEMKRQRLASAEKDKVGVGSSTVVPVASNVIVTEVVVPSSSAVVPCKHSRTEKTPATAACQASTDKGVCQEEGLVDAKNEQAQHSDLGQKVVDLETRLAGYEEMKMKVVGLEGKVALLGQDNVKLKEDKKIVEQSLKDMTAERDSLRVGLDQEKLKVKTAEEKYETDFQQLNAEAARSYGLGFEQALIQFKHFNPTVDVSDCVFLKELINNKLVDLRDGGEENGSADGLDNEEVADLQGPKVNKPAEEVNEAGNEE